MKKALLALSLLALTQPAFALSEGDRAPGFSLPKVNGGTMKLSDYKGKVVLVNFWATWCPPCRREIPDFTRVYKKYSKQGFVILGLSVDQEGASPVKSAIKEMSINYPVAMANQETVDAYGGIRAIPTSFLVDKNGKLTQKVVGGIDEKRLEAMLQPLLKVSGKAGK